MNLIKIYSDRIQLKTDLEHLKQMKINDLLLLTDRQTEIVCMVTGIVENDQGIKTDETEFEEFSLDEFESINTVECSIIGSIINGKFEKSIDIYPTTQVVIKKIDDATFREMITSNKGSSFDIGKYASYDARAMIDGNKFFQRHSAVIGNTGSGKSFAVANMLEKISKLKSSNVIIFDLHGEYDQLSFTKNIKIGNSGLAFPIWFMSLTDIAGNLLKIKEETSTSQMAVLRELYYVARESEASENKPIQFDIENIINGLKKLDNEVVCEGYYKNGEPKEKKGAYNGKLTKLIKVIEDKMLDKRYEFMFEDKQQFYFNEFVNTVLNNDKSNLKVIDLSQVPHDIVPTVIGVLTNLLYQIQISQERSEMVPLTLICDEAHVYIPADNFKLSASQRRILEVFEKIAKEGRKFGTSLCIVSQRPSELNKTIMAQCANYLVLKISNENDRQLIKSILPEGSRHIIDAVNLFRPGNGIIVGDSTPIPLKIQLDLASEQPKSNTIEFWDLWSQKRVLDINKIVSEYMVN